MLKDVDSPPLRIPVVVEVALAVQGFEVLSDIVKALDLLLLELLEQLMGTPGLAC